MNSLDRIPEPSTGTRKYLRAYRTICRYVALLPDSAQIKPPGLHRRTPEISAGHRSREAEQGVHRSVFFASHAFELRFERVKRSSKSDEHQSRARRVRPRHRAAQDEGLRSEAFLSGPLHMRGGGRGADLLVVAPAPADRVVLVLARLRRKSIEIVNPLLHGYERGTFDAGSLVG